MYRMDHSNGPEYQPQVYWNVDNPVYPGNTGDDVRLIQYLLNYFEQSTGASQLLVVDGIWGPLTSASMTRFENNIDGSGLSVHDGFISPLPQGTVTIDWTQRTIYKLAHLHWIYVSVRVGQSPDAASLEQNNEMVTEMPENPDCQADLAAALRRARGY
jgi:hypothetical protein